VSERPELATLAGDAGITRRQFLIAGGAGAVVLAGGGAAAVEFLPLREWYYRLTGAYGPRPHTAPVSATKYVAGTLKSATVVGGVSYSLAFPPGTSPGKPAPVCLCLPGRGMAPHDVFDRIHVADYVAEAAAAGHVRPFVLAAVDGGISYWHKRASGEDRLAMLFNEFIPLLREQGLGVDRAHRAILGWSMGGYGALLAAERRPQLFCAVAVTSAAIWPTPGETVAGAFDDREDWQANDVYSGAGRLAKMRVCIDCGRADPFFHNDQKFAGALPAAPTGEFGTGSHTVEYFARMAPSQVRFLGAAFAAQPA
jgi:enterochelin esterase-like enzyme